MKAMMIVFMVLFSLLSLASWITAGVWYHWWYPKTYEASLKLADDASLPDAKAAYLKQYLEAVNTIKGEPRYIFKRPDLDLSKQRAILSGLITRFEDLSKILPSEMAYQQGMEQLTGQEMDNQLSRISGIFKAAKVRENFLLFFFIYFCSWLFPIFACVAGGFLYALDQQMKGVSVCI